MQSDRINYLPYVLKFDGQKDHIVFPDMNIDYSQGLTIEAWVFYNSFQSWSRIIDFSNRPINKDKIVFANFAATNTLALDIKRGEIEQRITANNALETGKWMHLAATIDASGNGKIYKNGQEIQAGKIHLPESLNRTQNYIGKSHNAADGYFDGRMSEMRLWNRVRTAEEIQKDLHRRLTGNEPGLVAYWPLNEGTGDTVSKGGKISGATWHQEIFFPPKDPLSYPQLLLSFHGMKDYVEIKDPFENNKEFTICLWVKPSILNDGEERGLLGKTGDKYRKPGLSITPDKSGLYFDSYDASGKRYDGRVDNFFEAKDQWVHITWVKQGLEYKIYRNGQLLATKPAPESFYTNKDTSYWIGGGEYFFSGEIAEVSIWNKVRTRAEIQANLSKQLAGNEAGLVGYWPFDESSGETAKDKTSRANNGKIVAANWGKETSIKVTIPTSEPTFIKSALKFDGRDDYLEVAYNQSLNPSQFTVSAWVKVEGNQNGWRSVITSRNALPNRGYMLYGGDNNKWQFWIGTGGTWSIVSSTNNIEVNTWTHLTGTYDGTNEKLYINGELVASNASTFSVNPDKPLRIGAGTTEGNPQLFFPGQIAEVSVWNRARNQDEIIADMYRQLAGNESGLIAYWPLNEGSGNIATNKANRSEQGTINGATWQRQPNSAESYLQPVLNFDGNDDYIQFGNGINLAKTSFSIEFWAKRNSTKAWGLIVSQGVKNQNQGLHIGFRNNYMFTFAFYADDINTGTNLADTQWHHWTCTYDVTTKKQVIYRDSEKVVERTAVNDYQGTGVIYIGCWDAKELYFEGQIAEVRIWGKVRTPEEIKADMSRRLVGNESGLIAYWPLNEGTGNIANEKANNSNKATINGAIWQQNTSLPPSEQTLQLKSTLTFSQDFVEVKDPFENNKEFTICLWVKPSVINDGNWHGLIGKNRDKYLKPSLWLAPDKSGLGCESYDTAGKQFRYVLDNFFPAQNQWVHIAWVKRVTEYRLYRNGELFATKPAPESFYNNSETGYWLGRVDSFWPGEIAEVSIWNHALSDVEIKAGMRDRLAGNELGLVDYWPLNEGRDNTVKDLALRNNNGTINGATWGRQNFLKFRTRDFTYAQPILYFDGQNNYIEIKDPFENDKEFTISLWVKPSLINDGKSHGLIGKAGDKYQKPGLWLTPNGSGLLYDSYDPAGKRYSEQLNDFFQRAERWVHIMWVKKGTEYKFYRDRVLVATKPAPETFYTNKDSSYWIGGVDTFWLGAIAELSIWNCAILDSQSIERFFSHYLQLNEVGLVGYWPLSEAAGEIVKDKTKAGNHGTIKGAIWKEKEAIEPPYSVKDESFIKSPLTFDGQNDHIVLPEMNIDYSKGFTIEAWVYYNSFQSWSRIIDLCNLPTNKDKIVFAHLERTDTLVLDIKRGGTEQRITAEKALEIGKWIHLAATVDAAGNGKLYKNGQEIKSGKIHLPESVTRIQNYIGKSHGSGDGYFDGRMAELRLWNHARTAEELQKDMQRRLGGNETGLVGYWPLNERTGDRIIDQTSNGKHGTINGAIWLRTYTSDYLQPALTFAAKPGGVVKLATPFNNDKEFTICVWVKPLNLNDGSFHAIMTMPWSPSLFLAPENNGLYYHFWHSKTKTAGSLKDGVDGCLENFFEDENRWVHIAWLKRGKELCFYRNGELFATKPAPDDYNFGASSYCTVGYGTVRFVKPEAKESLFLGEISDISFWNRPCSEDEIKASMHRRLMGNEAGLVGYWPLDEGAGTQLFDRSSRGRNGEVNQLMWNQQILFANEPPQPCEQVRKIAELENKNKELEQQIAEQDNKVAEQDKKITAQEQKLADQDKKIAEQDNKVAEQDKKIAAQEQKLGEQAQKIAELEKKNSEQTRQTAELEQKLGEQDQKISELEQQNSELEQQNSEQDHKIAALEQQNSEQDHKNSEQDQKIAALEQQNSEQDQKIAALEQQNSGQDQKIAALEQQNSEQDQKIAALEQKLGKQHKKIAEQQKKNAEQDKLIAGQDQKNSEQDKLITELVQKIAELQNKIAEQEQKNIEQDKKDAEQDQKIAEQEQKISSKNEQQLVQKLQPSDLKSESFFGEEAAISGEWAIAGARKADGAGIQDTGLAYMFQLQNKKWEQKQKLQPADSLVGDQFGCAVTIGGEWAIVGAMKADSPSIKNTGTAYIFRLENGIWQQQQKLQPAGLSANDRFGKGIAISGEWAMVGAYHSKAFGLESGGAAYVFRLENGVWQQKQKLQPIDLKPNQCFGHAIAISGEWAIVGGGDRYASASIKRPGGAYIYHLENAVWRLKQKLQSPQPSVNDLFGYSVAIGGEYALVGAVSTTVSNNFAAGTVYSYKLEQGVWQQKQKLHPEKPKFCGFFGATVSISGEVAVVGSTRADSLEVKDTGSACIFQLENGMWQLKRTLQPTDLHYESYFGFSTPIDREWVFVTAAWAKTPNSKQVGAVYIFGAS